jgi:hypothetical protein
MLLGTDEEVEGTLGTPTRQAWQAHELSRALPPALVFAEVAGSPATDARERRDRRTLRDVVDVSDARPMDERRSGRSDRRVRPCSPRANRWFEASEQDADQPGPRSAAKRSRSAQRDHARQSEFGVLASYRYELITLPHFPPRP